MKRGERTRTDHLDVFFAASPDSFPRLGLVVPKHRHTIVERNRVKRRLREIGRIEVLPRLRSTGRPLDVLVRARPEAYEASFDALRDEFVRWVEDAGCGDS
jgi:ribonuclease P protein component